MQALFEHFWEEQSWDENLDEHVFGGLFQETLECKCGNIQKLPIQKIAEYYIFKSEVKQFRAA